MQSFALPGIDADRVQAALDRVWEQYAGPQGAQLEVAMLPSEDHTAVHGEQMQDPSVTDVMAFAYEDEDLYGEILVNAELCLSEGPKHGHSPAREALLYLIHGALHLLGFRDDVESARKEMRAAEARILGGMDA
ncbi:MAG: rRNA maturation RNase YbeY [Planctomycetota bacterium]|nr:MAG: rRNA maturation RNase YbeY [Planctomycetota bacterium]